MKADNSLAFEEKFQEGYSTAIKEIKSNILIAVENELYELTPRQFNIFHSIRMHSYNRERFHKSLDYVRANCNLLNDKIKTYNY